MLTKKELKALKKQAKALRNDKSEEMLENFIGPALMGARFGMFIYFQTMIHSQTSQKAREIIAESDEHPFDAEDLALVPDGEVLSLIQDCSEALHNQIGEWIVDQFAADENMKRACGVIAAQLDEDDESAKKMFISAVMGVNERIRSKDETESLSESIN
jgi:hypothetical protein